MSNITAKVILDSAAAQVNLDRLTNGLDRTNKMFGSMKQHLLGLGFAALAKGAIAAADEIKDLSDSSSMAIGTLKELQTAIGQVGGNSKDMTKFVSTFSKSIEEAAQGSMSAQNSFAKLGVTIKDFQDLSQKDLMLKTLDGISKLGTATEKTKAMMDMFGKSAMTVSSSGLAAELRATAGEGAAYTASITRAAELNDKFAKTAANIQFALLQAFSPVMDKLNAFIDGVNSGKNSMDLLIGAIKLAGIAFASWTILTTLRSVITVLGSAGRGLGVLAGLFAPVVVAAEKITPAAAKSAAALKAATDAAYANASGFSKSAGGIAKWAETTFAATGKAAKFLPSLRAISAIFATGFSVYAATQLFTEFGDIAGNAIARVVELVGELSGALAGGAIGAGFGSAFGPIGTIIGGLAGAFGGDKLFEALGFGKLIEKAKESREEIEKVAVAQQELASGKTTSEAVKDKPLGIVVDTTQSDNLRKSIEDVTAAYAKSNEKIREQIDLDASLIGKSKDYADQMRAVSALNDKTADEIQKLTDAKAKMNKEDRENGLGDTYDAQIAKIKELGAAEESRLKAAIANENRLQSLEQLRLYGISQQVALESQLRNLNNEKAKVFLPEIEKKYKDITAAANESAAAQIAAEEARTGQKLSQSEVNAYYAAAKKGVEELTAATAALNEEQNKFQLHLFGIQQEIDLTNNLNTIQDDMAKMTMPAIEQKYYDIAAAARNSAKAAVEAEEARRGEKLDPAEAQKYYDKAYAGVNKLTQATKKQWDMSRSFETGWKKAMNSYIDEATNAATKAEKLFTTAFKGMEDAIVGFAKTGKFEWKSFVSDMLEQLLRSQIQGVFANLMGSITGSLQGASASSQASGAADTGIMSMLGSLFGGSSTAGGSSAGGFGNQGSPVYVTNWPGGAAGGLSSILGGNQQGGASGSTGGIWDSITSGAGDLWDTVSGWFGGEASGTGAGSAQAGSLWGAPVAAATQDTSWFGDIASSVGGIADSIGDWFGGFFAQGGQIPSGKIGIVGERGPEFIGGPANITPMTAGNNGSSGTIINNYNTFNTIDQKSFQQWVAQDPAFMAAVVYQGNKGMGV